MMNIHKVVILVLQEEMEDKKVEIEEQIIK
jgi:hypothetical protein